MKFYKCTFFVLMIFLKTTIFVYITDGHGRHSTKVLIISFDGFRNDYFEIAEKKDMKLKFFRKVFLKGVKANHINNLFVTRTFPNHMSIITGCFEETHGVIDNNFYDPLYNESFSSREMSHNLQSRWFSAVEPLWVTNQKNGHKSGLVYWPGQLAPYLDEYYPTFTLGPYNRDVPLNYKFDVVLNWLKDDHMTLCFLYHPHPDIEGHKYGPNSTFVSSAVSQLDNSIGYLIESINKAGLKESLNIVILSDHGMSDISSLNKVAMNDYLNAQWYYSDREISFTLWGIWPRPGVKVSDIMAALGSVPHIKAYLKKDIPKEWHYANNRRVAPIVVLADEGWVLVHNNNDTFTDNGAHGFTVSSRNMNGIFVAWGPNIVISNQTTAAVREIDVFPLIAEILGLNDIPQINGSLSRVRWILNNNVNEGSVISSFIIVCVVSLLCALTVCIMISCAHYHAKSVHLQKVSQTYALQTGKLMRMSQSNSQKGADFVKFKRSQKKRSKMAAADTAFLLESSSGNEDEILGEVNTSVHKYAS